MRHYEGPGVVTIATLGDAVREALEYPDDFSRWLREGDPDRTFDMLAPCGCALYEYLAEAKGIPVSGVWYSRVDVSNGIRTGKVPLVGEIGWAGRLQRWFANRPNVPQGAVGERRLDETVAGVPEILRALAEVS